MELSSENVVEYLRKAGRVPAKGEVLVQNLSGSDGPARSTVLKVFDVNAGGKIGSDARSAAQKKAGTPDTRSGTGICMIIKQPLEGVIKGSAGATEEVDERAMSQPVDPGNLKPIGLARIRAEKACIDLLTEQLPEGSVPANCWVDEDECIVGMDCAPPSAISWKKQLASGVTTTAAATHAGMLLAMMHSSTKKDAAVKERFGDAKLFSRAKLEPGILAAVGKNGEVAKMLQDAVFRARTPLCLIHGDFVPGNILLIPGSVQQEEEIDPRAGGNAPPPQLKGYDLAHLMIVDFDSAYFGHAAFDVASLTAELLLMGFLREGKWRAYMMMADNFWQTYRHTADPDLVRGSDVAGGRILGALLLGRIDGTRGVEGIQDRRGAADRVRKLAGEILKKSNISLDEAIDAASMYYGDS